MTVQKSPSRRATEYRALTSFDVLPAGHKTFLIENDGSDPHLRVGEYAVIDTADRDLQHGELYLLQYEHGRRRRVVIQVRSDHLNVTGPGAAPSLVWWYSQLRGFRKVGVTHGDVPLFEGLSEGPYQTERLQSKMIGRIVGVARSSLGQVIEPEAGFLDEARSNAAFSPVEYVDTLLACGYGPLVSYNRKGDPCAYMEYMPERRLSKEEDAAIDAVRTKFCAASTARDRVIQECIRRGLTDRRSAS